MLNQKRSARATTAPAESCLPNASLWLPSRAIPSQCFFFLTGNLKSRRRRSSRQARLTGLPVHVCWKRQLPPGCPSSRPAPAPQFVRNLLTAAPLPWRCAADKQFSCMAAQISTIWSCLPSLHAAKQSKNIVLSLQEIFCSHQVFHTLLISNNFWYSPHHCCSDILLVVVVERIL